MVQHHHHFFFFFAFPLELAKNGALVVQGDGKHRFASCKQQFNNTLLIK